MTAQPTKLVWRLSMRIRKLLAGHPPQVQSAVLADLLSVFIVGCHPALREEALAAHIQLVRDIIPETEKEIFPHGKPEGWDKQ